MNERIDTGIACAYANFAVSALPVWRSRYRAASSLFAPSSEAEFFCVRLSLLPDFVCCFSFSQENTLFLEPSFLPSSRSSPCKGETRSFVSSIPAQNVRCCAIRAKTSTRTHSVLWGSRRVACAIADVCAVPSRVAEDLRRSREVM